MPDDQQWDMLLEEFMYSCFSQFWGYNTEVYICCSAFIENFFKQSDEQMQEAIQNANFLQLNAMFACFEMLNVKEDSRVDIYNKKLKICLDTCRAISFEHLVISDKSKPEDVVLRNMLQKHGLRKKLAKIKTQNPLVKDLLFRYSKYIETCERVPWRNVLEEFLSLFDDGRNLRDVLKVSFVNFLVLINCRSFPASIFKYIDFLEPEYFEWDKLIDFVNFAIKYNYYFQVPPMVHLSLEEAREKTANFINKITVEHILLIKYGAHNRNKPGKSNKVVKKFIKNAYTFKQLVLFWHAPKLLYLNNNAANPSPHIENVRSIFLNVILSEMKVSNLNNIISLFITHQNITTTLLKKCNNSVLLSLHYCIFYMQGGKEMFDGCKENVKERFGDVIVKKLERLKPEYILELICEKDYCNFAHYLSCATISKIFLMLKKPPEYIRGYRGEVYSMQDILSENAGDNFLFALCEGLKNNVLHDKSQELKDLILQKAKEYEIADLQFEVDGFEALQGAVGASCGDEENIRKRALGLDAENDCEVVVEKCFKPDVSRM